MSTKVDAPILQQQLLHFLLQQEPAQFFHLAWENSEYIPARKAYLVLGTSERPAVLVESVTDPKIRGATRWTISWWDDAGSLGGCWMYRSFRECTVLGNDALGYTIPESPCEPKNWYHDVANAIRTAA